MIHKNVENSVEKRSWYCFSDHTKSKGSERSKEVIGRLVIFVYNVMPP